MIPKPRGLEPQYGAQFQDSSIVAAYENRPPYPPEVFTILNDLIADEPRVALDAGCGRGEIARNLAPFAARASGCRAATTRGCAGSSRRWKMPNCSHLMR